MSSINSLTLGEMYCGAGGIGLGATLARAVVSNTEVGYKHLWATDYHLDACRTYKQNIGQFERNLEVIRADVRELKLEDLPPVDGFLYGFPCNDFSLVGQSKGLDGSYGPLYSYGVDYINHHNPKFFMAENVSGISSANGGRAFKTILQSLQQAGTGYRVTAHLYKFEQYCVPQKRHRVILVGIRSDLNKHFKVPKGANRIVTAREALCEPKIPIESPNHELTRQSKIVQERLSHIKPGENAWTAKLPKHLQLNVKGAKLSMIYRKLDPNKPAYTITGSGGGGTHVYHWNHDRALTNRERARLQTFPDNFEFLGNKESVRRQIGMAVPPVAAKAILEAILKTFHDIDYEYEKASILQPDECL